MTSEDKPSSWEEATKTTILLMKERQLECDKQQFVSQFAASYMAGWYISERYNNLDASARHAKQNAEAAWEAWRAVNDD